MGPKRCPETSVRNYPYMLCIRLENRSSDVLRGESLKSRNLKSPSSSSLFHDLLKRLKIKLEPKSSV